MKTVIKSIAIVLAGCTLQLAIASTAEAHSGGTNSEGCHWDHSNGTYHCH